MIMIRLSRNSIDFVREPIPVTMGNITSSRLSLMAQRRIRIIRSRR